MSNQGQKVGIFGVGVFVSGPSVPLHLERYKAKMVRRSGDCGIDIYGTHIIKSIGLGSHSQVIFEIGTAFHVTPAMGTFGLLTSRSSGIESLMGGQVIDGKIDAGYTGELLVRVVCPKADEDTVRMAIGVCISDRIALAQLIFILFCQPHFALASGLVLPDTGRGASGFGSTNKLI